MPMPEFLSHEPADAAATLLLAHGAGAPMDSPFMAAFAAMLAERGLAVSRFEFAYMAERRKGGAKRPPPRGEKLVDEYAHAVTALGERRPLFLGGKSLGGRVASLAAARLAEEPGIAGLVCLGFPFHPPGRPEKLRTGALIAAKLPVLICQGTRDPFGTFDEVETYRLPPRIRFHWARDGNHDLVPRKASGLTANDNWSGAADAVSTWTAEVGQGLCA